MLDLKSKMWKTTLTVFGGDVSGAQAEKQCNRNPKGFCLAHFELKNFTIKDEFMQSL